MHVLDVVSCKWTTVEGKGYCDGRSGHCCAILNNEVYFFGGNTGRGTTNDLFKYSPSVGEWIMFPHSPAAPSPRELAVMTTISDSCLLLYGGVHIEQELLFDDAYLHRQNCWLALTVRNSPSPRIKTSQATLGTSIYSFGGEGPSQHNSLLFNDLYELMVDELTLELNFREVAVSGARPPCRTAHGMAGLNNEMLLIYGGEGLEDSREVSGQEVVGSRSVILDDIWVFLLQEL